MPGHSHANAERLKRGSFHGGTVGGGGTAILPAMTTPTEQQFLNELDKKLWTAADRLRSSLDAAVYKHAVLGLIFRKYVSDSFENRQKEVLTLPAITRDHDHKKNIVTLAVATCGRRHRIAHTCPNTRSSSPCRRRRCR